MKWTRFIQEFDVGGLLSKYGSSNQLKPIAKTPVNKAEPHVYVSEKPNLIIDNCFRIYKDPDSLKAIIYEGGDLETRANSYHPWIYHSKDYDELPDSYFNKDEYFKEIELNEKYEERENKDIKKVKKYVGKNHPYEIFIGGWVHFYDEKVRHGETDHAIYFDWNPDPLIKSVTVHILQTKPNIGWNVYVKVNPPGSQDPPPPKSPPPPC
jgi:hypothetical protein